MNEEGNVDHELVGIPTADGVKNIHPDVLKGLRDEAFEYLEKETQAKADLKDLFGEAEQKLGIKKSLISKWIKAQYKAKTEETKAVGKTFEALDEAVPAPVN